MALEGAGLGLALLAEARGIVSSLQERMSSYKEAPVLFAIVDDTLSRLMATVDNISGIVGANPDTLPQALRHIFVDTLSTVKETLSKANNALNVYCTNAFFGSGSGNCFRAVASKGKRFFKAKSLTAYMNDIQRETCDAKHMLQHLLTQLTVTLEAGNVRTTIEEKVSQSEGFRPAFNAPMLPGNVRLDFKWRDADGKFNAPEADLKSFVLISTSTRNVTVARGATATTDVYLPVHGVSGMAGVGKTIALIGLGHDKDIQDHFVDGVLFMSVGATANEAHLTSELSKIMRVTGATTTAAEVQSSKSLADAVSNAALWFYGKRILFLIDDIWPSATRPEGYLPDLQGLLQGSPDSRIAVSTRSLQVATKSGSHVDFGPRDRYGSTSVAIFMAYAAPDLHPSDRDLEAMRPILGLCSGLPISLSMAGAAISNSVKSGLRFEYACLTYFENISHEMVLYPGALFLDNAIRLSIGAVAAECETRASGIELNQDSVSDLYTSLCVLQNQQFAPIAVLSRMWKLSEANTRNICLMFSSMSLGKTSTQVLDGREQCGMHIHDLHLEYCRESANRGNTMKEWHKRLLNGHVSLDASVHESGAVYDVGVPLGLNMLEYTPRKWWQDNVSNKEYILRHLSRHLRNAGLHLELGATMLDIRWIAQQGCTGGVLGVKNDVDILEIAVEKSSELLRAHVPSVTGVCASVKLVAQTLLTFGSSLNEGTRVLSHLLFAHLFLLSKRDEFIYHFLERMKEAVPKPFLEPTVSCYRPPGDAVLFHIEQKLPGHTGLSYLSADYCEKYGVSGANHDVVVVCIRTRNRLQWLKGHSDDVNIVKFNSDASRIISGSFDKTIIVWDWQNSASPLSTLRGHKGAVSALSFGSEDRIIFSGCMAGTLKMWDVGSGELSNEFVYGAGIECVSTSPTSKIVAFGTRDGFLRCVNWASGQCAFEYSTVGNDNISSVQFGTDGRFLVCGSALGQATSWNTSDWKTVATVCIPGSVAKIAFHPDGTNVVLASSTGEIRHWIVKDRELSSYNVAMARPLNGISFRNNGNDIIVGTMLGYSRAWSGPQSSPGLDFQDFRNNLLYNFALSGDGSYVATTTHDATIRVWATETGLPFAAYTSPDDGSRCLALSVDGKNIASASPSGSIRVWNTEQPPCDSDITFQADENDVNCLAFGPDSSRLLVCLKDEVQIWDLEAKQVLGCVPSLGSLNAAFSSNGIFIVVGNTTQTIIWEATSGEAIFDTSATSPQSLSFPEAKNVIQTCGPSAHRMWPLSLRSSESISRPLTELTVDNFFHFATPRFQPAHMDFSRDVFVLNYFGVLVVYKLRK